MADQKQNKLTDKQRRFCQEYIIDLNAKQAAIRTGYSHETAENQASRLLSYVKVQNEVAKLQKEKSKELKYDSKFVLKELLKQATFNIKDFINVKQITLKDAKGENFVRDYIHLKDWDNLDGTLISEIKQNKDLMIQVKFYDKQKALELIGRHLGMWIDKHEVTGKDGGPVQSENIDKLEKIIENMSEEDREIFFEIYERSNGIK